MRTPAQARRSAAAAEAREPGAGRRRRAAPASAPVADAPETADAPDAPPIPSVPEPPAVAVTTVRMLRVDEGLHALRIGEITGSPAQVAGMAVPAAHVSAPFAEDGNGVEIIASFPRRGPWLAREGGTTILRSPLGGGYVIVTVYGGPGQETSDLSLDLRRLDGPGDGLEEAGAPAARAAARRAPATGTRDIQTEILLHIERAGDRLFPGRGWVGALGRRMRIEAFSIRPLEGLAPADIEMKGLLPNGGETPWVPGGTLCGTRGRGLPLIGFAVRVAPQRADQFEVLYQGSFFVGGISDLYQNGDPCRATTADDPLEAINVRLVERVADPEETDAAG
jgi:hypothetical protein